MYHGLNSNDIAYIVKAFEFFDESYFDEQLAEVLRMTAVVAPDRVPAYEATAAAARLALYGN